ncbi:hypothetical protein G4V62_13880 [Bacillaceae bacterium SIJ1]|nr:hypothetical protein [Litoribacterium kuwaitense]NGP45984.1 hypothetical protein [Litoribacterium kuwaitense]
MDRNFFEDFTARLIEQENETDKEYKKISNEIDEQRMRMEQRRKERGFLR